MNSPRSQTQTYSTTSPMNSNPGRCSLSQSTTQSTKPRFAAVRDMVDKIKSKKKNNKKNKSKNNKLFKKNIKKNNKNNKKNNKKNKKNKSIDHSNTSSSTKNSRSSRKSSNSKCSNIICGSTNIQNKDKSNPNLPQSTKSTSNSSKSKPSQPSKQSKQSKQAQNDDDEKYVSQSPKTRFSFKLKEEDLPQSSISPSVTIKKYGYSIIKKIADTLQGQIYRCKIIERNDKLNYFDNNNVVIKVTNKDLYNRGITIMENGSFKKIQEDIIKETDLMKELTFNNAPSSMVRYIDFFEDINNYYLVLEDGGNDLFEYVVKCHNLLRKGKLDRKEWRLTIKKIFQQIVKLLDWLHNEQNICHLDISLENMLIKNGNILQNIHNGKITLSRNFQVKFCDFGLSEKFENKIFKCTKYVGKTRYKSPELWTKNKIFDARLNDIWSLGISLFMMVMGAPPLKYPDYNDENFKLIINGQILQLIQSWNRAKYMTPQILDLLKKMLTKENNRINLKEIKAHSWVKLD